MRHIERIMPIRRLARAFERVIEAEDLVMRGEQETAAIGGNANPHATRKRALEHRELAIRPDAEQEELAGLIGGEGQAAARYMQPLHEMARRGECELFGLLLRLR